MDGVTIGKMAVKIGLAAVLIGSAVGDFLSTRLEVDESENELRPVDADPSPLIPPGISE